MDQEYAISYIYRVLDEFSPALKKIQAETEKMGNSVQNAGEKATKHMGLFSQAVGAIVTAEGLISMGEQAFEFGKDCVNAAEKSNAAITLLKNNLSNLGRSKDFPELEEQANQLAKNSIFNGEQVLTGTTAALLRFGNINGDMFTKAQQVAMNYAVAVHGVKATQEDLASASQLVGRALETGNIRQFQKYGVIFSAYEQEEAAKLKRMGNIPALQAMVMNKLANAPGLSGAMDALTQTPEGMMMQIHNSMDKMKVGIGTSLLPIITMFMQLGVQAMPYIQKALDKILPLIKQFVQFLQDHKEEIKSFLEKIGTVLDAAGDTVSFLWNVFSGLFSFIWDNRNIFAVLTAGIIALTIAANAAGIAETLMGIKTLVLNTIMNAAAVQAWLLDAAMNANPVMVVIIALTALAALIVLVITHWKELTKVLGAAFQMPTGEALDRANDLAKGMGSDEFAFSTEQARKAAKSAGDVVIPDEFAFSTEQARKAAKSAGEGKGQPKSILPPVAKPKNKTGNENKPVITIYTEKDMKVKYGKPQGNTQFQAGYAQ